MLLIPGKTLSFKMIFDFSPKECQAVCSQRSIKSEQVWQMRSQDFTVSRNSLEIENSGREVTLPHRIMIMIMIIICNSTFLKL